MSHLSLRSKNNNYNNSQNPKKLRKNRSLDDSQLSFKLQEKSINSENDFKNYQNYKKLKTDYDEACSLIDKNVLADLRALVNPPYMAKLSAEAILILLEITNRKVNWNEVKKHLSKNIKFLDSVRNFEPEILSKDKLLKLEIDYLSNPDFNVTFIKNRSISAGKLANFVIRAYRFGEFCEYFRAMGEYM